MPKPIEAADRRVADDNAVHELPLRSIHPSETNPRQTFDQADLDELATSIQALGFLNPLIVEPDPDTRGEYLLVAGERRWRAAQLLGMGLVPAMIRRWRDPAEREAVMLAENLQRVELSPLEEAAAYRRLIDQHGLTVTQVAAYVGRSKGHVSKRISLLKLPAQAREQVAAGELTLEDAGTLARMPKADQRAALEHPDGITAAVAEAKPTPPDPTPPLDPAGQPTDEGARDLAPELPPAARAPQPGPRWVAGLDVEHDPRWLHARELVNARTKPILLANHLLSDLARILGKAREVDGFAIQTELVDWLLADPAVDYTAEDAPSNPRVERAASSTPQKRYAVPAAALLSALLLARTDALEPDELDHALDRLFRQTGYSGGGAA